MKYSCARTYSSRCSFKLSLERNGEKCIGCREDAVHEVCRKSKMGNPTYFVLHARVLINVSTCHLLNSFNAWSACSSIHPNAWSACSSIHPLQMLLPSSDDQFTKCSVRLFINTSTPSARSGCSSIILPPSDDQFTISPFQFTRSSHPALLPLTRSFPLLSGVHSHSFVVWCQPPSFTSVCLSCLYFMPLCHPLHLISCSTNVADVSS